MPFKSQAQRGFMFSEKPKLAKEFEAATPKGADLPYHVPKHMAEGGEVSPTAPELQDDDFTKGVQGGFNDEINSGLTKARAFLEDTHKKFIANQGENGTFPKWEKQLKTDKPPVHMFQGGNPSLAQLAGGMPPIDPSNFDVNGGDSVTAPVPLQSAPQPPPNFPLSFPNAANNYSVLNSTPSTPTTPPPPPPSGPTMAAPQPQQPPSLTQTTRAIQQAPATDYNFYKNMTAEDRMALQQKLAQQQRGPQALIAQGLGGLGDAISNSFGGKNNTFQKNIMEGQKGQREEALNAFDTQRIQKLQDMQANQEAIMNDPHHPVAAAMQKMLRSAGLNVPSGMPASVMLKVAGPLGELAFKQAQIQEAGAYHKGELGQAAAGLQEKTDVYKSEHPILNYLNPVGGGNPTSPVSNTNAPHGIPDLGQTFNGGKVTGVRRIK